MWTSDGRKQCSVTASGRSYVSGKVASGTVPRCPHGSCLAAAPRPPCSCITGAELGLRGLLACAIQRTQDSIKHAVSSESLDREGQTIDTGAWLVIPDSGLDSLLPLSVSWFLHFYIKAISHCFLGWWWAFSMITKVHRLGDSMN